MLYDLSLQPHWSGPATQISFAVMMAGALPRPGSVMGTMTVATWVMKTRGIIVVGILILPLFPHLLALCPPLHPRLRPPSSSSLPLAVHPLVFPISSPPSPLLLPSSSRYSGCWWIRVHTTGGVLCGRHWQSVPGILVSCRRSPFQGADIPDFSCLTRYFVHVSFSGFLAQGGSGLLCLTNVCSNNKMPEAKDFDTAWASVGDSLQKQSH